MTLDYRRWWDCDLDFVPFRTGAASVMGCEDLLAVWDKLGVTLAGKRVLDVGCGTGRVGDHCDSYQGLDVAPAMVGATRKRGHQAALIRVPSDVLKYEADLVICSSVFTHIPHDHREAYLRVFARVAPECVVDIIPGDGTGEIANWSAVPEEFEQALDDTGWLPLGVFEITGPGEIQHRYYHCERA